MAEILFSDRSPQFCYAAHCLLSDDKVYFKNKGDGYEARSENQVEEIKHQLEVEQQRQREKSQFLQRLQQALAGETVEWSESDRIRLESLEKFILQPEQKYPAAMDILSLLGRSQTPEAAFELLVDLKWWSSHENLLNFPETIPAGIDDCTGLVHMARFLRGYVGDGQDLWLQGRKILGEVNKVTLLSLYRHIF